MRLFHAMWTRVSVLPIVKKPAKWLSNGEPQWMWLYPTYVLLGLASIRTKLAVTPHFKDGLLLSNHMDLINGAGTAPTQYRLLQYYVPELIHRLFGIDLVNAYLLQRLGWTTLTVLVFHVYLRKWFDTKVAMIGTLFLLATMQWTYLNHLQEAEPLNVFIFLIGLFAIREKAFWWLLVIVMVGALNKLTVIFLPLLYFTCWFKTTRTMGLLAKTLVLSMLVALICGTIRWYFHPIPYMTSFFQWQYNGSGILFFQGWKFFGVIFLYGMFWIAAFRFWGKKPLFLRRAALVVPLYCLGHFLIARINETRLFLPLAPIIIPAGLFYIFRENNNFIRDNSDRNFDAKKE